MPGLSSSASLVSSSSASVISSALASQPVHSLNQNSQYEPAPPLPKASSIDDLLKNAPKELVDDCIELKKLLKVEGMSKHEARACLALDISGSMENPNNFIYGYQDADKGCLYHEDFFYFL